MPNRREFIAWLGGSATLLSGAADPVGFAFGTYGMKSLQPADALRTLARIGYDGVELALMPGWPTESVTLKAVQRAELRRILADTGLALPAVQDSLPLIGTPAKRAYNQDRLKRAMEIAHDLSPDKPACIDTVLGLKSSDWDKAKGRMLDELHEWAKLAESAAVTVAVKPHAGQAMDTPEKALWMIHQLGSTRIRLTYDYSHMFVGGFPLESSLRMLLPSTAFISLKDSRGDPAQYAFLLPGDGKTDYLAYFRLLKEFGYTGFASVEISSMIHQKPGYDPVTTAQRCYDRLAPLFLQAGLARTRR